jgi:hypothetical protein
MIGVVKIIVPALVQRHPLFGLLDYSLFLLLKQIHAHLLFITRRHWNTKRLSSVFVEREGGDTV